jgi:hypothetical protein
MQGTKQASAIVAVVVGTMVVWGCEREIVTPLVASKITVQPNEADLPEGQDLQLTATVLDAFDQTLSRAAVTWSADDRAIVRVSSDGRARALTAGATLVRASFDGVEGWAFINVLPSPECAPLAEKPSGKKGDGGKNKKRKNQGDDDDDDNDDEDDQEEDDEENEDDEDDDDGNGDDDEDDADPRCAPPVAEDD